MIINRWADKADIHGLLIYSGPVGLTTVEVYQMPDGTTSVFLVGKYVTYRIHSGLLNGKWKAAIDSLTCMAASLGLEEVGNYEPRNHTNAAEKMD